MSKSLIKVFLYAFMAGCLAVVAFGTYILYRQHEAVEDAFGVSYIYKIKKGWVIGSMLAGTVGLWTAYFNILLSRQWKKLANVFTIFHIIVCVLAMTAAYRIIVGIEGKFLLHSRYFKWYLYVAVPIAICTLLGLAGVFLNLSRKAQY